MNLVTLDFETYFADDYTLSKMTTESYVRDPRFKVHCIGTKLNNCPVVVNSGNMAMRGVAYLAHHAHFDGLILSQHFQNMPTFWFDTLSMARLLFPHAKSHSLGALARMLGLQEKTVPYESFKNIRDLPPDLYQRVAAGCANDVELTYAVFQKMLPFVLRDELRIIDLTVRMFTEPALRLDRDILVKYLADTKDQKDEMLAACGCTKEDVGSADKFASLLLGLGVDPPTKISKKTGKVAYAFAKTDAGLKELLEHSDDRVVNLVETRLGVKSNMVQTRAQRMLEMDARGAMAVYLKYYGAHTGRWSGGDRMNWQNFKRGSVLREAVLAPGGCVVCVVDSAQIECRILNWLAGEEHVLEAFRDKRDLYSEGASRFYDRPITKADKIERHLGKTLELGCGYGMGHEKFRATCKLGALGGPAIDLSENEARAAVNSYRSSHKKVKALWKEGDRILRCLFAGSEATWGPMQVKNRRIYYPNGSWSDYTNLRHDGQDFYTDTRKGAAKIYGAKLVENVVQALARLVLAEKMLQIAPRFKIVTTTHDEIVYLALKADATEALEFGMQTMKTTPVWALGLPLDAEGGYARNYSK